MSTVSTIIPDGYKQTEIGVFPEDWEIKKFGEIFDFKSTASNSRSDLTETDKTHYIHYGDIHTIFHRHLDISKNETPRIDLSLCKNATLIRNGDWVMADASEDFSGICKAIEISGIDEGKSVVAGLHTFLLRDRNEEYSPGFKGHLGEAKYLHDQYVRVSVGLKVFGVTKTSLRELLIPVPPKNEQNMINKILTDVGSQVEALEHLIAKKKDIKKGTMQELLTGKSRFTEFTDKWLSSSLIHIVNIEKGKQLNKMDVDENGLYPHYNGGIEPSNYTNIWNADENHIIISEGGNSCGYVQFVRQKFWTGGHCYVLSKSKINNNFLFWALKAVQSKIMRLRVGSGLPNVQKSALMDFEIIYPSNEKEQEKIAEVLSDMDSEIAALEERLEKAKAIKQGMMQQLLTGKIRLVD